MEILEIFDSLFRRRRPIHRRIDHVLQHDLKDGVNATEEEDVIQYNRFTFEIPIDILTYKNEGCCLY